MSINNTTLIINHKERDCKNSESEIVKKVANFSQSY